ncbi:Uncharacterised protein [Mycobacteroides abscessus subsp. abscessus]|nr:Uncharacterised protein [Mycobacteroides abscessus subsp. abscessus]
MNSDLPQSSRDALQMGVDGHVVRLDQKKVQMFLACRMFWSRRMNRRAIRKR